MENKERCQSCGMPVSVDFGNYGTRADGSAETEFCQFCFQNGDFTNPDQTVEEMVRSSVDFMTANLGFTHDKASEMSNDIIPRLRRWQS